MVGYRLLLVMAALGMASCVATLDGQTARKDSGMAQRSYAGVIAAPEFPTGLEWLNIDRALSLRNLRGKVVLLDFWTYCCINCMHMFPVLRKLESKYERELIVIGVHSGKFTEEHDTKNIREAILRHEIKHPVVNDKSFQMWRDYRVKAWPSFVIIDPDGRIVGSQSGEIPYELFDEVIGGVVKEFETRQRLDRTRLALGQERFGPTDSILLFPGKLAADNQGRRLFVSDSNHNRIVILSLPEGAVLDVVGEGKAGLKDGTFAVAQFNRPQGVAWDSETLYVADTENHAIRKVDLGARTVVTLAGTGRQARRHNVSGQGTQVELSSPWDLVVHDHTLYIAMAGQHQLWTLDLRTRDVRPYAGSGEENLTDGSLSAAALAQPSGITTDGRRLFFADSEASAIRSADLDPAGRVETIVGAGLFEFGDRDGSGSEVRLQHPLGVTCHDGMLYLADTYNNKIKRISVRTRESRTIVGTGEPGMRDGPASSAQLNEPNGVTFVGGRLFITDSNNHLIRVYDPQTKLVSTLTLRNDREWNRAGP